MMRLLLSSLATLILAAPLLAGVARADDCANAMDQATMDECAGKDFDAADKKLNDAYKQIEGRLKDNAGSKKLLVDAQRAWVAFRDAECAFQGGPQAETRAASVRWWSPIARRGSPTSG